VNRKSPQKTPVKMENDEKEKEAPFFLDFFKRPMAATRLKAAWDAFS